MNMIRDLENYANKLFEHFEIFNFLTLSLEPMQMVEIYRDFVTIIFFTRYITKTWVVGKDRRIPIAMVMTLHPQCFSWIPIH